MNCEQINELLDDRTIRKGGPVPRDAESHLKHCNVCRSLYLFLVHDPGAEQLSPDSRKRIESTLLGTLRPIVPLVSRRSFVLQAFAAFLLLSLAGVILIGGHRPESTASAAVWIVVTVAAISAVFLAIQLRSQMIPGSYQRVLPLAVLVVAALEVSMWLLFPRSGSAGFVTRGLPCWNAGVLLAIPSAAIFFYLVRRGAFLEQGAPGGTLGSLSGLVSATALQLSCPLLEATHLSIWHGGLVLATSLIGFCLGSWVGVARKGRKA